MHKTVAIWLIAVITPILFAQAAPTTSPADLQAELSRLQAENIALRQRVAALEVAARAGPATRPTTQPATHPFSTMADILVNTPADLQPQTESKAMAEWRKYTEGKFLDWWEGQLRDLAFEQALAFYPRVGRHLVSRPDAPWDLSGGFAKKPFNYFGSDNHWIVTFPTRGITETEAKKWDRVKAGTLFKVKGIISEVSVSDTERFTGKKPAFDLILHLKNFELTPLTGG